MERAPALIPSSPRDRLRQVWPFASTFLLALALTLVSESARRNSELLALATMVTVAAVVAILLAPWTRLSEWWTLAPVAGVGLIVHLLRDASGGGTTAGFGSLLLLPVVWQALHRKASVLICSVAVVTAANIAGVFLLESPATPAAQWRSVTLFAVTAAGVGWTIHRLSGERDRLLAEVARLASHDALTGLPNRRAWEELAPALSLLDVSAPTAIAMIDLDRFKAYNDEHGHDGGDQLLIAVAESWRRVIREHDLLVRWGGEEFALLLPSTTVATADLVLARLQAEMPSGQTFSAGVAVHDPGRDRVTTGLETTVKAADRALYAAKRAGRACVSHATE